MDPSCSKSYFATDFKILQDTVLDNLSKSKIKSEALVKLKEHFRERITSKRVFGRIRDFEGLFKILKKRGELSCSKLEPFKSAADIIGDKNLKQKISKFEEKYQGIEFRDLYENATTFDYENNSQSQEAHSARVTSPNIRATTFRGFQPYNSTRETEIGKRVLNRISERIGIKWRDMARNLDIRECDIDAIDLKHPRDLKEKAYEALKIAQAESDPRRWKRNLMHALVEARRRDLSDWVHENYYED